MTSTLEPFEAREPLILVSVQRTYTEGGDAYEAARGCWRVVVERARRYVLVLAHKDGIVAGAFRPDEWLPAASDQLLRCADDSGRWGFVGSDAEPEAWAYYVGSGVPDHLRGRNPVRYADLE